MSRVPVSKPAPPAAAHEILFQSWFKSVGPRTYAAQVKKANNGNHYLVLTEGKRDDKSGEIRKTRLFLFSEDFIEFFKMLKETAVFVRDHPVPDEVKNKRSRFWSKQGRAPAGAGAPPQAGKPRRNPAQNVASTSGVIASKKYISSDTRRPPRQAATAGRN